MIPLAVPNLVGNEARYLQDCVDSTFVSSVGPFVDRFEREVGDAAGTVLPAVATSAGTTALHASLVATGVGPDDLVLLPSFTFVASANAIAHCGASPWLVDVTADSWTMDVVLLRYLLTSECLWDGQTLRRNACGRRVAAVVPVHVLGLPADMDAIVAVAREYRLKVVADGAAALGARYKGRRVGQLGADLTIISFNGNKTVTAGGGGAVVGNDAELLNLVRHLTTTARIGSDYLHDRVGFNYRMTNLQAAVGCAQLEQLEKFVARKQHIRTFYDHAFAGIDGATSFPNLSDLDSECWFSGLLLDESRFPSLEHIRLALRDKGVDARPFWRPMHLQPAFAQAPHTDMPVSNAIWHRILTLPCSTGISDAELERVVSTVIEVLA
jgi:perosamine synthetase